MKMILKNFFVLKKIKSNKNYPVLVVLCFLVCCNYSFAQKRIVKGKITESEDGGNLPHATVRIKGTNITTLSDSKGNYEIKIPDSAIVVYSCPGFSTIEILVKGNEQNITLINLQIDLSEKVNPNDKVIKRKYISEPVYNGLKNSNHYKLSGQLLSELSKNVPGILTHQSHLSSQSNLLILNRGPHSLLLPAYPLFISDGVPVDLIFFDNDRFTPYKFNEHNFNLFPFIFYDDMDYVSYITGSSASKFGGRGANGIININTKTKGAKREFLFCFETGISTLNIKNKFIDAPTYNNLLYEAAINDSVYYGIPVAESLLPYNEVINSPHQNTENRIPINDLVQNGIFQQIKASYITQNDTFQVYNSIVFKKEKSILLNQYSNHLTGRLNIGYDPFSKLHIGLNTFGFYSNNSMHPHENNAGIRNSLSRNLPQYNLMQSLTDSLRLNFDPFWQVENMKYNSLIQYFLVSPNAEYKVMPDLFLRFTGGVQHSLLKSNYFRDTIGVISSYANREIRKLWHYSAKMHAFFHRELDEIHSFDFNAGIAFDFKSRNGSDEYLNNALQSIDFYKGDSYKYQLDSSGNKVINDDYNLKKLYPYHTSYFSIFGSARYIFSEKFISLLSLNIDGSSLFGVNKRYFWYPGASFAWVLSSEERIQLPVWVNLLKLSLAYGASGNSDLPSSFQYGSYTKDENITYAGHPVLKPFKLPHPDLKPEKTHSFNFMIEHKMLKNKLNGSFCIYYDYITDLLLPQRVPLSTGWGAVIANAGIMRNSGIEMALSSTNIKRSFLWTTDLSLAFNNNKVLKANDIDYSYFSHSDLCTIQEGYALGAYKTIHVASINEETGLPVYNNGKGQFSTDYSEVSSSNNSYLIKGNAYPSTYGSLTNNISYLGFYISAVLQFRLGQYVYDFMQQNQYTQTGTWNLSTEIEKRWQKPGDVTSIPRLSFYPSKEYTGDRQTNEFLHKASTIEIPSLTFGYNIPGKFIDKLGINKAVVLFQIKNLFFYSTYKNMNAQSIRAWSSNFDKNLYLNTVEEDLFYVKQYLCSIQLRL